ncbi:MAG: DUF1801 domain-containing protein [Pseudomonadales bacterium]|nr:DUF1801 domain-containing protein [Pseudomonadales bacterium]
MADTRLFPLEDARTRHPDVEHWLAERPGELGALARRWFDELRRAGPDVTEVMHDGHATACVGDLAFAYVNVFSAHLNVGFFLGTSLRDPAGLLVGTGRFMRHVKIRPGDDTDTNALRALIAAAYRDMRARRSDPA